MRPARGVALRCRYVRITLTEVGTRSTGRGIDDVADVVKCVASVGAEGADGADADDDDQGQHHGVLDRGGAVFVGEEIDEGLGETAHGTVPFCCQEAFTSAPQAPLARATAGLKSACQSI